MSWTSFSLVGGDSPSSYVKRSGDTMTGDLEVRKGTPRFRLFDTGTEGLFKLEASGNVEDRSEAHGLLDITPRLGTVPRISRLRVFRTTNVETDAVIEIFRGDGTAALSHRFSGRGNVFLAVGQGKVSIGHENPLATLDVGGTDGLVVPRGTTGERPESPPNGLLRYNTTTGAFEGRANDAWVTFGAGGGGGGTLTGVVAAPEVVVTNVASGTTLTAADHRVDELFVSGSTLVARRLRAVRVTGTGDVTCTLPNGVGVGTSFEIRNGATGQLTINAQSGSTINGGSSVVVPWANGVAFVTAVAVSGSNVTWEAYGDTVEGVALPKTTVKGELVVEGPAKIGRRHVLANMTGNLTLTDAMAGGTLVATATGVLTVPTTWRGILVFLNRSGGNVTVTVSGVGSHTVPNGQGAVIEAFDRTGGTERFVWPMSPATLS